MSGIIANLQTKRDAYENHIQTVASVLSVQLLGRKKISTHREGSQEREQPLYEDKDKKAFALVLHTMGTGAQTCGSGT